MKVSSKVIVLCKSDTKLEVATNQGLMHVQL